MTHNPKKKKGKKMGTRGFKLYIDGETVKNKFNEDIIVYDEPRKITEGRFEILTFTEKEWKDLQILLNIKLDDKNDKKDFEAIMKAAKEKANNEISGIYDLYNWLNFGEYRHADEDNTYYIDEIEEKPFYIWDGEAIDDYGAGKTFLDSEWYGMQEWDGSNWVWITGKEYKEI